MSTFFDGLGIKLFDGLPAIPTCCRASGNGHREDTGKGFLCDARITGYALKQNIEQMPGPPTYYFDLTEQRFAKRKYCDVEKSLPRRARL
jgi:hypothetical protein